MTDHSKTSGGVLAKSVPRPKTEDSTVYMNSLSEA